MEQSDFEELLGLARQTVQILKTVFEDLAEEELDLESALKRYPLVTIGLAAGAGAIAGWWAGSRSKPTQLQLPPPDAPAIEPSNTPSFFDQILPTVERMRKSVPDSVADDAAAAARNWMDTVLEPKLRQGVDNISSNVGESKWGSRFRQAMRRMDSEEDIHLDDPEHK